MSGYGKHFESMYTGSMFGAGAAVFAVWGYAISHHRDGKVELNDQLLAATLGEPLERIQAALDVLCAPDPRSRTKDEDGRRLIREGQFLYRVVNAESYGAQRSEDERREYQKEWAKSKRRQSTSTQPVDASTAVDNVDRRRPLQISDSDSDSEAASEDLTPHSPPSARESATMPRAKRSAERGTRLTEDWVPNTERADLKSLIAKFVAAGGDYPTAVVEFRNHWTARSRDATKLDWEKTLANRLIVLTDRLAFRRRAPPTAVSAHQRTVDTARRLLDEARAKEAS